MPVQCQLLAKDESWLLKLTRQLATYQAATDAWARGMNF
jgi:hypothetical protein